MPNIDDTNVLIQVHTSGTGPFSYGLLTGIEDTRSHKSQLWLLYRYDNVAEGTPVDDIVWENWYDPFLIPVDLFTADQSVKSVTIGDLSAVTVTSKTGTPYTMPAFDLTGAAQLDIYRSQDVDNKVVTFGDGSRVTSDALNNAIGQNFRSVQELDDRVTRLEGGEFEADISIGGGGSGAVDSVNGRTGDVVLDNTDVGAAPTVHTHAISDVVDLVNQLSLKLEDAPIDGNRYARQNGAWSIAATGGGGGIPEAPENGNLYARRDAAWETFSPGIGDADANGQLYGRQNNAWVLVPDAPVTSVNGDTGVVNLGLTDLNSVSSSVDDLNGNLITWNGFGWVGIGRQAIVDDTNAVQSTDVTNIVELTQAAYDALGSKDANTLYVIVG